MKLWPNIDKVKEILYKTNQYITVFVLSEYLFKIVSSEEGFTNYTELDILNLSMENELNISEN